MKCQRGFSLIESLISVAILSFGVIATTKMQVNMALATQTSRQRTEAVALAKNKIELFRNTGTCNPVEAGVYTPLQGNTTYNITITCDDPKTAKITVLWYDARGGQVKTVGNTVSNVANNVTLVTSLN